jgi:hypothetical protein
MPSPKSAFSGLPLGNQASRPLDQRLFTPPSPRTLYRPPAAASDPAPPTVPPASASAPPPLRQPAAQWASSIHELFDLRRRPLYKLTYLYTEEETKALDTLQAVLASATDEKVTKTDLLRAALHMLVEDHAANGAASYVARKLATRHRG